MVDAPHRVGILRVSMDYVPRDYGHAASLGCVLLGTWGDLGEYSHCLVSVARFPQAHVVAARACRSLAHTLGEAVTKAGTQRMSKTEIWYNV